MLSKLFAYITILRDQMTEFKILKIGEFQLRKEKNWIAMLLWLCNKRSMFGGKIPEEYTKILIE